MVVSLVDLLVDAMVELSVDVMVACLAEPSAVERVELTVDMSDAETAVQ